jgi:bacillithiol system protein YtxJ
MAMTIQSLTTAEDLDGTLELSNEKPVMILKHSTRCPVSFAARQEFETYAESAVERGIACCLVLVVENRALSQEIAARLGVRHQSPQVIFLKNGEALWHDSHDRVNVEALKSAESNPSP